MKRTLVISDIHGCYDEFIQLLKDVQYKPGTDKLILLGDLVDRGPRSKDVVEHVISLSLEGDVVVLRGNHDQRFIDVMKSQQTIEEDLKFFKYGGLQAIDSYVESSLEQTKEERLKNAKVFINSSYSNHIEFLNSLPLYYEDPNHIYVHAGLNPSYPDWRDQPKTDFMYIQDPFIKTKTKVDKMVVFGHTKTFDIHGSADIWFGGDKIGIDGGCAYGLQLNCLEVNENGEYKQFNVSSKKGGT